ncbi:hypothetical protein [Adhaeribacter terreus]|uniref:SCP2 domain-containing protein n=1 Tax=Adhaeribacter terreus TaxID=529703 RepID=A0ABW0EBL1_9BACT
MFVHIEEFWDSEKVKFYSLRIEDADYFETDNFIERFSDSEHKRDLEVIIEALQTIGGKRGAEERYFRPKKNARALPQIKGAKLRLYCIRVSNDIVILGNGDIKTARTDQECPNVGPIFEFMNKLEAAFTNKVREKEIIVGNKNLIGDLILEIHYNRKA